MEQLTNFEVLAWLQARKAVRSIESKAQPREPSRSQGRAPGEAPQESLVSQAVLARVAEVKWVETKAIKYLSSGPAGRQSASLLKDILKTVDAKSEEWGISLTTKQKAQLLDSLPTTALDLYLCIDACPGFDDDHQSELAAEIAALVAKHEAAAAAAKASETPAGLKRSRSNSSATAQRSASAVGATAAAASAPAPASAPVSSESAASAVAAATAEMPGPPAATADNAEPQEEVEVLPAAPAKAAKRAGRQGSKRGGRGGAAE